MLTPSFTVSQTPAAPAYCVFEDTSSGSDVLVTSRRITVTNSQGDYVVPSGTTTSYIPWPLGSNPITINLLTEDTACNITVQWLDVSDTTLYEVSEDFCLSQFNQQFFYYLTQQLALNPSTLQDVSYMTNLGNYWTLITGAINAVEIGDDIANSQNLLNMATNMMDNQNLFF